MTFATPAWRMLLAKTVTVAVGTPVNATLLADVDEMEEAESKTTVTLDVPPNLKLSDTDDTDAPDVVTRLVPDSAPTMDTPNPADVMVDAITLRPVADAAPR